VPLLESEALRRLSDVDARVVDEHVETAEAGQGSLDEGLHRGLVVHIHLDGLRLRPQVT